MRQTIRKDVPDLLRRDPWLIAKYAGAALVLSLIGKSMMIGAISGAGVPRFWGQFVPTVPMLPISYMAYKYVMGQRHLRLLSYVSAQWSGLYAAEVLIGHSAYSLFAVQLGMGYIYVSAAIGLVTFVVTLPFAVRIFCQKVQETVIVAPPALSP